MYNKDSIKTFVIDFMYQGNKWRSFWLPLVLSLLIGLVVGWIDSGKHWDDTGITVFAISIPSPGIIRKSHKRFLMV